jgi:tryptophan 2,3-dioxygenase
LDTLLTSQNIRSEPAEHDELLFIIVHQVYELWFKQILHELDFMQTALQKNDATTISAGFKRVLSILKTLVSQLDILETMLPVSFNSFRDRLESASGLQSIQFREIEFVLGKKNPSVLSRYPKDSQAFQQLSSRLNAPSLWNNFLQFLTLNDFSIPAALLNATPNQETKASESVQSTLIYIYQKHLPIMQICERFVDLDEGLQEWRYHHLKMVERTIGSKEGTGSLGVQYLASTLSKPLFPDLWQIRAKL